MKMLQKIKDYFKLEPPHIWVAIEALRQDMNHLHRDMYDIESEVQHFLKVLNELSDKIVQLKASPKPKKDTKPEKPKPKKTRKSKE